MTHRERTTLPRGFSRAFCLKATDQRPLDNGVPAVTLRSVFASSLCRRTAVCAIVCGAASLGSCHPSSTDRRGDQDIDRLLQQLRTGDTAQRLRAVDAIASSAASECAIEDALLTVLDEGTPLEVREAVIDALMQVGGVASVRALSRTLSADDYQSYGRSVEAIAWIWQLRGSCTWPALPEAMRVAVGQVVAGDEVVRRAPVEICVDQRPGFSAGSAGRITLRGTTNDDGTFRIGVPDAPGFASMWVKCGGAWRLVRTGDYPVATKFWARTIYRVSAKTVGCRMRISASDGTALVGALVRLVVGDKGAPALHSRPAVADGHGDVLIAGLDRANYWADVSCSGYAPGRVCVQMESEPITTQQDVVLGTARRVQVRVEDGKGRPVTGSRLYYCFAEEDAEEGLLPPGWSVDVPADGNVSLDVPTTGVVWITATTPNGKVEDELTVDCVSVTLRVPKADVR